MYDRVVPINLENHRNSQMIPFSDYNFAKQVNIALLMTAEFPVAAASYPIVFIEQPNSDDFMPVVLLGLAPGENLFLDTAGQWTASYVPAMIRRFPFTLARTDEEGRFTVCVDAASGLLVESGGRPLFNAEGQPAEALEWVKSFLLSLQQMETVTAQFCRVLRERNLLAPLNLRIREGRGQREITGCYVVNEERFNGLNSDAFLELRRNQYLQPIYSHIVSLGQIERLVRERDRKAAVMG